MLTWQQFISQARSDVSSYTTKASSLLGLADDLLEGLEIGTEGLISKAAGKILELPAQVIGFLDAAEQITSAMMWLIKPGSCARIIAGVFGFLLLIAGLITLGLAAV